MAYAHTAHPASALAFQDKSAAKPATKPARGLLSRFFHYLAEANQRRAEHEIARYLESHGGKFTDATEREIEHRFLSNAMR